MCPQLGLNKNELQICVSSHNDFFENVVSSSLDGDDDDF